MFSSTKASRFLKRKKHEQKPKRKKKKRIKKRSSNPFDFVFKNLATKRPNLWTFQQAMVGMTDLHSHTSNLQHTGAWVNIVSFSSANTIFFSPDEIRKNKRPKPKRCLKKTRRYLNKRTNKPKVFFPSPYIAKQMTNHKWNPINMVWGKTEHLRDIIAIYGYG